MAKKATCKPKQHRTMVVTSNKKLLVTKGIDTSNKDANKNTHTSIYYCANLWNVSSQDFGLVELVSYLNPAQHSLISSFLFLVVRHLLLEAMHLFLVADCF